MKERLWTRDLVGLPEDHVEIGWYEIRNGRVIITDSGLSFKDLGDRGIVGGKTVDGTVGVSYLFPQQTGVGLFVTRVGWGIAERLLNIVNRVADHFVKGEN